MENFGKNILKQNCWVSRGRYMQRKITPKLPFYYSKLDQQPPSDLYNFLNRLFSKMIQPSIPNAVLKIQKCKLF